MAKFPLQCAGADVKADEEALDGVDDFGLVDKKDAKFLQNAVAKKYRFLSALSVSCVGGGAEDEVYISARVLKGDTSSTRQGN